MQPSVKRETRLYQSAISLEAVFPRIVRRYIKYFLYFTTSALFFASIVYVLNYSLLVGAFSLDALLVGSGAFFYGVFQMSFALLFFTSMLTFYYNSRFYRGIESITHDGMESSTKGISYEVGYVLGRGYKDATKALYSSKYGIEMLNRCGISREEVVKFLEKKRKILSVANIELADEGFLTLEDLAAFIYKNDNEFSEFIFSKGITAEVFNGAVVWTMQTHHEDKHNSRWWSRDNLGRIEPIGRDWAYGSAFMLEEYSRDIKTTAVFSILSRNIAYADEKIDQMEAIFTRAKDANAILIGEQGVGKMDIIMRFSERIRNGEAPPSLVGKRIVVLNTGSFIARHDNKELLENGLVDLFTQAESSGNIVIVIDKFPEFLESAANIGVNAAGIMDAFLASDELQFITTTDPVQYHSKVETRPSLLARFGGVHIDTPNLASTISILQKVATASERRYGILFTYPAIEVIAESADQYITEGVMPNKAVELLGEVAPNAARSGVEKVTKEYVYEYVTTKTGIPTGPVQESERDRLLNLEDVLHKRVIGQEAAIKAISGVMRRSRAGIQDKERPLGSFMFLGSTGVGKTETAKALALTFFEGEENMSRIDMSEYSGADALERFIGDGKNSVGALPLLLKEKPYGVLLLDELEKAATPIHDLFLQIIDEGVFTDARGKKINARNSIIIATTNAGADIIWNLAKEGKNPNDVKDKIIDSIIEGGIYRPEFLNRFDGLIMFEPLNLDDQEKIAKIMLSELQERIEKKGYELVVDDVLVNMLVKEGYTPEFGARPMRRIMQDMIEEKIAEKIIAGGLKKGEKIWFYEEDFKV